MSNNAGLLREIAEQLRDATEQHKQLTSLLKECKEPLVFASRNRDSKVGCKADLALLQRIETMGQSTVTTIKPNSSQSLVALSMMALQRVKRLEEMTRLCVEEASLLKELMEPLTFACHNRETEEASVADRALLNRIEGYFKAPMSDSEAVYSTARSGMSFERYDRPVPQSQVGHVQHSKTTLREAIRNIIKHRMS